MVLPTRGRIPFSPRGSLRHSPRSQRSFVMSPRNSVLAKRILEAAEVCLRWKDLSRLSRYATVRLCLSFWLYILQKLFDILMASTNFAASQAQSQSPQKDTRSLISHLLHIAASPPDNAERPQYNNLPHLDSMTWDSIPTELRKVSKIPWTRGIPQTFGREKSI